MDVRAGRLSLSQAIFLINAVDLQLKTLVDNCAAEPDISVIERFMVEAHKRNLCP